MDFHRRLQFLRWNLLILMIITNSFFTTATSTRVSEEDKVNLELYYETLCPYCSIFVVDYLYKIFDNGLIDIINLKLIPYGNAKITPNGTIRCQVVWNSLTQYPYLFALSFQVKIYNYFCSDYWNGKTDTVQEILIVRIHVLGSWFSLFFESQLLWFFSERIVKIQFFCFQA